MYMNRCYGLKMTQSTTNPEEDPQVHGANGPPTSHEFSERKSACIALLDGAVLLADACKRAELEQQGRYAYLKRSRPIPWQVLHDEIAKKQNIKSDDKPFGSSAESPVSPEVMPRAPINPWPTLPPMPPAPIRPCVAHDLREHVAVTRRPPTCGGPEYWTPPGGIVSPWCNCAPFTDEDSEIHRIHYATYHHFLKDRYRQWIVHLAYMHALETLTQMHYWQELCQLAVVCRQFRRWRLVMMIYDTGTMARERWLRMEWSGAAVRDPRVARSRPSLQERVMWYHDVHGRQQWSTVLWRVGELHTVQWEGGYIMSRDALMVHGQLQPHANRRPLQRYVYAPQL